MSNHSIIDSYKETNRVTRQRARARKAGLPATLTLAQWKKTLKYYDQMCAYCKATRFRVLDHFIPCNYGGGTTADNCVPACDACNDLKLSMHPTLIPDELGMNQSIQEIQTYLQTRREEVAG